ncbi:MAG: XdhC family protein [Spirochaetaceae bacterium]|nr:XdhC family protein [Spirochaetaceae bacterium]
MSSFWERVHGHLGAGSRVFVACVAEHTRGSPGTAGAKLLVAETGELFGTIGGGAMEQRLVDHARALLQGDNHGPAKQTLMHSEDAAGDQSGLICEGSQTNIFCVLDGPCDLASVRTIVDRVRDDQRGWIEIDGAGLRLAEIGAGFDAPRITFTEADGRWRYREDLLNRRRIAVIGGGHCAAALGAVMAPLGYRVHVFDTRARVVSHDRATAVGGLSIVADYADVGPAIDHPEFTATVVMTADYRTDVRALLGVAPLSFPFIGLMGGRKKIARILSLLREEGISPETIERIHAPVGLDIGSQTPEEIAISIAAQILRERNRR